LLALQLVDKLVAMKLAEPSSRWQTERSKTVEVVTNRVEAKIDRQAQGEALRNLAKVLTWAGKTDEANRAALQSAKLLGGDVET
jgi:hypothetical protein